MCGIRINKAKENEKKSLRWSQGRNVTITVQLTQFSLVAQCFLCAPRTSLHNAEPKSVIKVCPGDDVAEARDGFGGKARRTGREDAAQT